MDVTRAVVLKKYGDLEAITVEDFELPPLAGNIEIQVHFAGLNFADLYTRQGLIARKLPMVLGMECTGTITKVGVPDTNFKVGQKVICYDHNGGLYRDVVRVTPDKVYVMPEKIGLQEGAAIFVNYLTAYFSINDIGRLQKGETVLLLSCAGGVGWAATQLAKLVEDTKVVGTATSGKREECMKNGVDIVIPPTESAIIQASPSGYDLIISNESGSLFQFLQTQLTPLGRLILIGANEMVNQNQRFNLFNAVKSWFSAPKNVPLQLLIMNRIIAGLHLGDLTTKNQARVREVLEEVFKLIKKKRIKPRIHSVYSISDYVQATILLSDRKNIGKVLIRMHETTCVDSGGNGEK